MGRGPLYPIDRLVRRPRGDVVAEERVWLPGGYDMTSLARIVTPTWPGDSTLV